MDAVRPPITTTTIIIILVVVFVVVLVIIISSNNIIRRGPPRSRPSRKLDRNLETLSKMDRRCFWLWIH